MRSRNSHMVSATLLGAAALVGGMGLTVSSAWLITMSAEHPPLMVLSVSIVMVRFFGISRSAARYGERILSHESVFRRLTAIRTSIFNSLSSKVFRFARDMNSGNFVKTLVDDVERAQEYQLRVVLPRTIAIISLSVAASIAAWIFLPLLILLIPVSLIFLFIIPAYVGKRCLSLSSDIENVENYYSHVLSDTSYGLLESRIYGYSSKLIEATRLAEGAIFESECAQLRSIRKVQFFALATLGSTITGTSILMYQVHQSQNLPPVTIAMAIFLPLVAFEGITNWYPNLFTSGKLLRAQGSVDEILREGNHQVVIDSPSPVSFTLELNGFDVRWNEPLFTPVSTSVESGEVLVVRGKSGSGKSTLAMGLAGLLPYTGSATLGGVEIRDIDDLSPYLSATLQRGHIFNTSVRENLRIAAPNASDEELIRVLHALELDALELDEILGEFGRPISGGEAKRLGVARALLSPAPVVILDEPTEHLDEALAARIEERILGLCRNRSLIVITHGGWAKSTRTVVIERE